MAWTDAQKQYCMYVICTVESGCDYGAVNTGDPITLGIAQWYGRRAANLCARLATDAPDSYAKLSERVRSAVEDIDNVNWDRFWLAASDSESWKQAAQDDACHKVQDEQFYADLDGYLGTLGYWGVNTDNVPSTIFYISAYHQSPAACLRVIRSIGGDRSIGDIRNACLNDSTLGGYVNRYNRVYGLLAEWDGTSNPPDFGQSGSTTVPTEPSNPSGSDDTLSSTVAYIQAVGNDLVVFGAMSSTSKLICHNTGKDIWIPSAGTLPDQPSSGGDVPPYVPPATGIPSDWEACKRMWEDNADRWRYSNASGRLNPPASGYSDCSACIWWAVNAATNNKYQWLGTRSYTMRDTATLVRKFDPDQPLDTSDMLPGDLIIMTYGPGSSIGNGLGHVDWYWGNNVLWSAGYAPLPHHQTDDASGYYVRGNPRWHISDIGIYRFLE